MAVAGFGCLLKSACHPCDIALFSSASAGGNWFQNDVAPEHAITGEDTGKEIGWTNALIVQAVANPFSRRVSRTEVLVEGLLEISSPTSRAEQGHQGHH